MLDKYDLELLDKMERVMLASSNPGTVERLAGEQLFIYLRRNPEKAKQHLNKLRAGVA